MKNKSNWTSRAKTSWGFKRFKPKGETKAVEDKHWISKEIYDKTLEEKMDEILEMSREINYNKLVYDFKSFKDFKDLTLKILLNLKVQCIIIIN